MVDAQISSFQYINFSNDTIRIEQLNNYGFYDIVTNYCNQWDYMEDSFFNFFLIAFLIWFGTSFLAKYFEIKIDKHLFTLSEHEELKDNKILIKFLKFIGFNEFYIRLNLFAHINKMSILLIFFRVFVLYGYYKQWS